MSKGLQEQRKTSSEHIAEIEHRHFSTIQNEIVERVKS